MSEVAVVFPEALSKRFNEAAAKRRRRFYTDLLSQYCPDCQLEPIECTRHAKSRNLSHSRGETPVPAQMCSDYIRSRGQVEQVSQPSEQCRQHRRQRVTHLHQERI